MLKWRVGEVELLSVMNTPPLSQTSPYSL